MQPLWEVLVERDGISYDEALTLISDAQARVREGEDPEEILCSEFGLEPDWVFDLIA